MQTNAHWPVIWNINPQTLEQHFDRCICSESDCYLDGIIDDTDKCVAGEDSVVFNFVNLISPSEDFPNDMTAIEYMSTSSSLRHLLEHPLIAGFLFLKWDRLKLMFYADFLCYFLLALIIGCISMYYLANPVHYLPEMCTFTIIFSAYVAVRRILQVVFCSSTHLHSWENYLNCVHTSLIIGFLVLFLVFHTPTVAAVCIVLITFEFFTLAGTFWHVSTYSEMFIAVAWSSTKSLLLYAIFLPAFSFLFYILLREPTQIDAEAADLNKFSTFGSSFMKTIVMSTGEFDATDINFNVNAISVYVFVGFIFLISTVFMNLLNGLAVSDTQKIQSNAELTSLRRRCRVLARYEELLSGRSHQFRYFDQKNPTLSISIALIFHSFKLTIGILAFVG